ncbi:hypothetical protein B0A55_00643 [Friedmanniomyces simplex]|uniref:Uncharacterized protein n=1 Tax=Friedmanniomyces simplex TaxID=329884 RepID=A0A4V5NII0_9PEZI|nr:hypothetical protein B0A55_00643 [Friedmanniomyces simplex]
MANVLVASDLLRTDLVLLSRRLTEVLNRRTTTPRILYSMLATCFALLMLGTQILEQRLTTLGSLYVSLLSSTITYLAFPIFKRHLVQHCLANVGGVSEALERDELDL